MRTSFARIVGASGLALSALFAAPAAQASPMTSRPAVMAASSSSSSIRNQIRDLEAKVKALLEPAEWVVQTRSGAVASGTVYKLCNTHDDQCLGRKKQPKGTGISIGWLDAKEKTTEARLEKQSGGTIRYGDAVAVNVGGSYLCNEKRTHGISLKRRDKPCYEWRIDAPAGASKSGNLQVSHAFVLFNTKRNDSMVRCARSSRAMKGAKLKWGQTCSKSELAYTNRKIAKQLVDEIKQLKARL